MTLSRLSRTLSRVNALQVVVVTCIPPIPLPHAAMCARTRTSFNAPLSPRPPLYDYKKRRDRRDTREDNNLGPTQPRDRRDRLFVIPVKHKALSIAASPRCYAASYGTDSTVTCKIHSTGRAPPMGPPSGTAHPGNSARARVSVAGPAESELFSELEASSEREAHGR